jgi:hypothetical protein
VDSQSEQILNVLSGWLTARLDQASLTWVRDRQKLVQSNDTKVFFLAFGMTPRKVGKADLALTDDELAQARAVRPGWNPKGWSVDQAVRSLFVLSLPPQEPSVLVATLDQLFATGEVGELVALYQLLPLLPHPPAHVLRAAEGIRTNIKAVFCAVAHQNPYPAEQFSEDQWNQMVLKCQFIGVPMSPIVGLDQRANPGLASMVIDFIHERRAAHRTNPPDMWRCVGRCADQRGIDELKSVLNSGSPIERQAAALALSECPLPAAKTILAGANDLDQQVKSGKITWASIDAATQAQT